MPLILATRNPAKLDRYRRALTQFPDLPVLSPQDVGLDLAVAEDGRSAADNACLKARAYAAAAGLPALGIDEALFIPALPPDQQLGVLVRRNGGRSLSDEELLDAYLERARGLLPEQRAVQWVFALCLAFPDGRSFSDQAVWDGWLSDRPYRPYRPGYPLRAALIDAGTGKPVTHLSEAESRQRDQPVYNAIARLIGAWLSMNDAIQKGVGR